MTKLQAVTDDDFDKEVLESNIPVLVDFWAEWCGPCKIIAPVLEELAGDYEVKVKFMKINVDHNSQTSEAYSIRSIPTLLVFVGGKQVEQIIGAVPKTMIKAKIDAILA